jgi:Outer membrane efflux protein
VQRFVLGRDWWTLFRSNELTELVDRALRNNHDLKSAQAALRVARANYEAQKGALFAVVGVGETSSRQKVATADLAAPTVSGDPYFTLHTAQLTISYVPDVFGGIRRQVEAASAQAESQRFMLEAAYLTLTSNVALAAVQEASLNAQVEETQKAINAEELLTSGETYAQSFDSASRDWAALRSAKADTLAKATCRTTRSAERADWGIRRRRRASACHQQAAASDGAAARAFLAARRAAARRARSASQPARRQRLGRGGHRKPHPVVQHHRQHRQDQRSVRQSRQFRQFLFWTFAGSVTQTVFDGFTLEQRQRAAEAGLEQAMEQYKSTVVTSFQNVADVLQAIVLDGRSVKKAWEAREAAKENLCLTVAGFVGHSGKDDAGSVEDLKYVDDKQGGKQGIADAFGRWWKDVCRTRPDFENYLKKRLSERPLDGGNTPSGIDVVTSEQLYLSTQLTLVTARATRYMDAVALFQALGGG